MSLTNRTIPPIILKLIKLAKDDVEVSLGLDDYDTVKYEICIPGKYEKLVITDTPGGLAGRTRYDQEMMIEEIDDIFDVVMASVDTAIKRSSSPETDPVEYLSEGWLRVGEDIGRVSSKSETITTYRMKS